MKLTEANPAICDICLEDKVDPNREDGLCAECGAIADKYAFEESERMLELDDEDCGC